MVAQPDKIKTLRCLSEYNCFTVINLNEKFASQIYLDEKSKIKTSFKTPSGNIYCFNTIPFGLKNGLLTVQKTCDQILNEETFNQSVVRIGKQIVLFASQPAKNEANFRELSERFRDYNLLVEKMNVPLVNVTQIEIYDSIISYSQIIPNKRKLTSIKYLKICQTYVQLKCFQTFFASFTDKLVDYNILSGNLEVVTKAPPDTRPVTPRNNNNLVKQTAAYSKCFEQIKSRIGDLINPK